MERIQAEYPDYHQLSSTLFLVKSKSIAEKVAQAVGIKGDDSIQSGVVFRLNHSYAGFTSRALWDWLEQAEAQEE